MTLISTIFLYWDYLRNIIEKILCIYIEVKIQQLFLENTSIVFIRNDGTIDGAVAALMELFLKEMVKMIIGKPLCYGVRNIWSIVF